MKTKSIFLTILFFTGIIVQTGCDEQPLEQILTVDETPISATAEAATYSIEVNSNGAWTAIVEDSVNHAWCTLSNDSGTNDGTITVHVAENTLETTRSAMVKITLGSLTKSVVINQETAGDTGVFPIEIPFAEYSIEGTSCQWKPLSYPYPYRDTIVIINSKEDLKKYIECIGESDYPVIDFSTHTLLFAHGIASSSVISVNCNSLQQFLEQSYKMNVDLSLGSATVMSNWQVPILVSKVNNNAMIELIITMQP